VVDLRSLRQHRPTRFLSPRFVAVVDIVVAVCSCPPPPFRYHRYADNIAYAYAKPASILLTAAFAAVATQTLPKPQFVLGAAAVFASMWLYSK
jgi:hypothetical protein